MFTAPTISDFKTQFDRDFLFSVPSWGAAIGGTVAAGVITALQVLLGGQFYQKAPLLVITDPTGSGAAATLVVTNGAVSGTSGLAGGAAYSPAPTFQVVSQDGDTTLRRGVRDLDITRAQQASLINGNQACWPDQATWTYVTNLLAAHYLCRNILASTQGLGGQGEWLHASKTVGDITAAFDIPERVKKAANLAALCKTSYGFQYVELLLPKLWGGAFTVTRMSSP